MKDRETPGVAPGDDRAHWNELRFGDRVYRRLYAQVIYPVYHTLLGDGAVAAERDLMAHDRLSKSDLDDLCEGKLGRLLQAAASDVPYYRDQFKAAGVNPFEEAGTDCLKALPVLTKDLIRAEGGRLISERLAGNRLYANSTSGSTGSPLSFYTDRKSLAARKATVARNRRWLGVRRGDRVASLWGSPIDEARSRALRGRLHGVVARERLFSAYALRDEDMARYAEELGRYRPRLLVAYPSVMVEFAKFCKREGIRFDSLCGIVCSAEAMYSPQRATIEKCVAVPVYDRYGCREVGDIAHQVPGTEGLLVNSDRVHLEIVDNSGRECGPGELGHILVTDLDNYGSPLIRYRIGDLAVWGERAERGVGLPYPILAHVEGRSLDVVRTPNGNRIGGTFWTILFRERPGIALFQVVQSELAGVTVRYVRDPAVANIDFEYFQRRIKKHAGAEFNADFREVNEILPEPTGKYRIVVGFNAQDGVAVRG